MRHRRYFYRPLADACPYRRRSTSRRRQKSLGARSSICSSSAQRRWGYGRYKFPSDRRQRGRVAVATVTTANDLGLSAVAFPLQEHLGERFLTPTRGAYATVTTRR